ncbi:hypothetical protein TFLX_02039 [Thermoflexales bacterium]|nr:hypothetical protein TFLX_02039 [Thermoflexales bacterium]
MAVHSYSRRSFFKVIGLTTGALLLAPSSAQGAGNYFIARADTLGRKYVGTRDGLVFESVDRGKTWQQVANFGSHCAVQDLSDRRGQLHAQVGVGAHGFGLISADGRKWYTT